MNRPSRKGAPNWTVAEWDSLFVPYPPNGPRPTREQISAVAMSIGRSWDAVDWIWDDAARAIEGRQNEASERLKEYLRERGWHSQRLVDDNS
jgi:hypothetical protein